ncbi:MAG TPA: hypothetical protein PLB59_13170 [Bacteroidales bacterium]|mgnify:FL=1|nr:hypothetical protein [Bacteroidales bacterium]
MKKNISAFVIIMSVALIFGINSFAQKTFKGIITYTIAYSGNIDPATAAQQPKTMILSIYENKQKMNLPLGPINIDVITDGDNKTSTTLIDMMGDKKFYKITKEELDKKIAEEPVPAIAYKDETKTIAGYVCKKAEYAVTKDGETNTTVVYYTEELGNENLNYGGQFHSLKGVPLEYVITTPDGIITTWTASEVKKGKVKETDFLIPDDYVELSAEEKEQMMKMFSGEGEE